MKITGEHQELLEQLMALALGLIDPEGDDLHAIVDFQEWIKDTFVAPEWDLEEWQVKELVKTRVAIKLDELLGAIKDAQ